MKTVLITGATGFLGRHLSKFIDTLGWEVYISNTSIANLRDISNLYEYNNISFDYIFHLAAHTKAGSYCLTHMADQFEINQSINSNILKYWKDFQPQAKMIAMGTSCGYSPQLTLVEENYLLGEPEINLYTYAMTKRMLLVGLKAYAAQYGLKYIYYVPSTLYGPDFDVEDSHFIFDLIKKVYSGKYDDSKVTLWGDGHQCRELIYVNDVIKLMMDTLHLENRVLNLGTGAENSIRQYAEMLCEILEYDSRLIQYDTSKYVGARSKELDITQLQSLVNPIQLTELKSGLNSTVDYYKKFKLSQQ